MDNCQQNKQITARSQLGSAAHLLINTILNGQIIITYLSRLGLIIIKHINNKSTEIIVAEWVVVRGTVCVGIRGDQRVPAYLAPDLLLRVDT